MKNTEKLTVSHFYKRNWKAQVMESLKPVFVDFVIPEKGGAASSDLLWLRREWEGEAVVGYLDVSRDLSLALKYPVVDLPTLSLFYRGKVLKSCVGPARFHQDYRQAFKCLSDPVPAVTRWISIHTKIRHIGEIL